MTKKEPGLIIQFDDNNSDFKTQKFEVERFFRFFIEIAKEDFIKIANLELFMGWQKPCYYNKKHCQTHVQQ